MRKLTRGQSRLQSGEPARAARGLGERPLWGHPAAQGATRIAAGQKPFFSRESREHFSADQLAIAAAMITLGASLLGEFSDTCWQAEKYQGPGLMRRDQENDGTVKEPDSPRAQPKTRERDGAEHHHGDAACLRSC
jgi:hypothetical protein